ncbi:hypothetical protein ACPYO6_09430 [Georgenia sp. Z1344]|uniref:hypothetical protein n=1 Tax=Georgenia sp. Z1344 TaxID=3416706 RepID=UPI003CF2FC55
MAETPSTWLDDLAATDAELHATLAGRLELLGRDAWSRRTLEAEAALGQARATITLQDRLLRDLAVRHTELEDDIRELQNPGSTRAPGGGAPDDDAGPSRARRLLASVPGRAKVAVTDPARALRAVRRRLPGGGE